MGCARLVGGLLKVVYAWSLLIFPLDQNLFLHGVWL